MEGLRVDAVGLVVDGGRFGAGRPPDIGHLLPALGAAAVGGGQSFVAAAGEAFHLLGAARGQCLELGRVCLFCGRLRGFELLLDLVDRVGVFRFEFG